jgi:thymidylate synthase
MKVLYGRNVNELYVKGLQELSDWGVHETSRNGDVVVSPLPVTSVYERPCERVLLCRPSANPFFHLMESLWMLAGRDDVAFLNHYISDFGKRYGDEDSIHGAYGHRWRHALGFDQLEVVVQRLQANPQDRQCVVQMWDATSDHGVLFVGGGSEDLRGEWKDRPCNTHVYLRVRETLSTDAQQFGTTNKFLDLTVCCRSNDIVWGAYGANAVHFSMLQEYLAGRIGVGVGRMYQVSNNYHGYISELDKIGDPEAISINACYANDGIQPVPIGTDWEHWDDDLKKFMTWHDAVWRGAVLASWVTMPHYWNDWFADVAGVMVCAYHAHRRGVNQETTNRYLEVMTAPDWQLACRSWLEARRK